MMLCLCFKSEEVSTSSALMQCHRIKTLYIPGCHKYAFHCVHSEDHVDRHRQYQFKSEHLSHMSKQHLNPKTLDHEYWEIYLGCQHTFKTHTIFQQGLLHYFLLPVPPMLGFIYLFIFYIAWIFWDKPHLDMGIVNIDMNTLYNVLLCML